MQSVDRKTALLDRLRIDRTASPPASNTGRRWGWTIGIALAAIALVVAGVWILIWTVNRIPIHTAVAKALDGGGGSSAGTSLLDASGYVVAMRQATVSAKSIYKVTEVLVQEGQPVKQGEVIARLDDTNTRAALVQTMAQVKQYEAALAAAKLAADDARPGFLRSQSQLAEGLISPESFETTKAAYDATQAASLVAEQNLAVAKATVEVNRQYEDDTVIRSPFDGVVTVRNAQPGEIVSPQFSGGGGLVKVVDMGSLEVDVDVSENYINRVRPNQSATIMLNAYPDWRIPAAVIAVIPTADRSKATVKVRVGFKQSDSRIVPEMGARVSFLADRSQFHAGGATAAVTVVVPPEAVQADGESGIVFVVSGSSVKRREVRLGSRDANGQRVLSGLSAGEVLAIGDFSRLADGARVRIEQKSSPEGSLQQ